MGNWRIVHMTGICAPEDVPALRDLLSIDYMTDGFDDRIGCLHNGGVCSLPMWADEKIDAVGNLFERDYSVEDVADELRKIISDTAPGLRLRIDCGGDYETTDCVATILTDEDGTVRVLEPLVDTIPPISGEQLTNALSKYLFR